MYHHARPDGASHAHQRRPRHVLLGPRRRPPGLLPRPAPPPLHRRRRRLADLRPPRRRPRRPPQLPRRPAPPPPPPPHPRPLPLTPPPGNPHAISFYCTDLPATVADLRSRGVEFTTPITDQGFGLVTNLKAPG